jgi:hypothetical protein
MRSVRVKQVIAHHELSHGQPESLILLNQFFMGQLAYLCEKMAWVQEGERTLLDNISIMHCSGHAGARAIGRAILSIELAAPRDQVDLLDSPTILMA